MSALARHIPLGESTRLLALHVRSRNLITHLVAIVLVSSLYLALQHWASFDPAGEWGDGEVFKQFAVVQVVPALLASIVGMSVWSPFGEPERVLAMSLARLRAVYLLALVCTAVILSIWLLLGWVARQEDANLVAVALRNLLGLTGMALLAGRVLDARLTWLFPVCWSILVVLLAIRQAAEPGVWDLASWVWSGQPHSSTTSFLIALSLFLLGVGTFLHCGPKDTATET